MKTTKIIISIGLIAAVCFSGQYLIESKHRFLGYLIGIDPIQQNVNAVPDGQSGVTALTEGTDGNVYGGTSSVDGKAPYVFMFRDASNLVTATQSMDRKIKGQSRINNALVAGGDGYIYGGTSVYTDQLYVPTKAMRVKGYKGGHLFRFKEGKVSQIEDLGIVVTNDGIRTLAADPARKKIYGLTEPGYKFFIYDIKQKKKIVKRNVDLLEEKDNTYNHKRLVKLGRALVVADDGRVYGSAYESLLFCYDPDKNKLQVTDIVYPYVQAHEEINAISCFAKAKNNVIYGGTYTDGILFRFNSKTKKIVNLGKPSSTPFIRSLVITNSGKVCGVVGDNGFPTQVFEYDKGGFHIVGEIRCTIFKTDYNWYASDLCPAIYLKQGTVMFGERGRLGKLFAYYTN
jgi:hypothetical protein